MAVRYSLLDVVQKTLDAMDGDEVNTVAATTESRQVMTNAEIVYNDIITTAELPEQYRLYSLDPSNDTDIPIVMYRPTAYETMDWVKYKRTVDEDSGDTRLWTMMVPVALEEFLKRSDGLNPDDDNVSTMTLELAGTDLEINYYTDRSPDYFTTFDDTTILFNSIDTSVEATLQSSKTLAYGQYTTQFLGIDSFTPGFDSNVHQIWLNETIALCQARQRQFTDGKAEKAARRGWIKLQDLREGIALPYYDKLPNYSRK